MKDHTSRIRAALRCIVLTSLVVLLGLGAAAPAAAQQGHVIPLTLDRAVDMAMGNSYRVRQLQLGIERTRNWLAAERAGLKSRVYMNVTMPKIDAVSDNKWNSSLHKYEIIRENTRRWQANIAVRQPVILFGYPTDGYLSLNNTMYRYAQLNEGTDITYYNRYFIKYEQPFFQPNTLKSELEKAELNLERENLDFREDIIDMLDDIADDYYDLVGFAYKQVIYSQLVEDLERAEQVVLEATRQDTSRGIELSQVQVELANARERLKQSRSDYRMEATRMKQRLSLEDQDSLVVRPDLDVVPLQVDVEQAIQFGQTLRPQLRKLDLQRRRDEIDLASSKGWDSFQANLEVTYGRETQDPRLEELWNQPTNSYSVGFHAYIPIWDWGRHRARVQAMQISLRKTELYVEEAEKDIRSNIANAVQNLQEYQQRAMTMEENLEKAREIARASIERYVEGRLTILELLQSFTRSKDTAENFLTAYLGYRNAVLSLQTYTFYDFENDMPLYERFKGQLASGATLRERLGLGSDYMAP